jgi:hypothetical protein
MISFNLRNIHKKFLFSKNIFGICHKLELKNDNSFWSQIKSQKSHMDTAIGV